MKKVVLAYSGGLDTSFCVPYLKEQGYEVYSVTVDTGGFSPEDLTALEKRALELGVVSHRTLDGRKAVFDRFGAYIVKGNILRGQVYPLCVGAERMVQAEELVRYATEIGAMVVCHGSSGAGNDQVRFDGAIRYLAPDLTILAPIRELGISREEEHKKLAAWGFDFPLQKKKYSINQGILGTTIGGGETHHSWESIPDQAYVSTLNPAEAPASGVTITLGFDKGLPVSINSEAIPGHEIIVELNQLGGAHGIGRGVHVGDTVMGIKGRIAFEAPGALTLIQAHRELEKLVLTKWQSYLKDMIVPLYGMLLHEGQWFNPVMRDIEACLDSTQLKVTGDVRVHLEKGVVQVLGARSPYSLMDARAQYGEGSALWDGRDAEGFCKIAGLQAMLAGMSSKGDAHA